MPAPDWLRQAVEEHGSRACSERWSVSQWLLLLGTNYRAREARRLCERASYDHPAALALCAEEWRSERRSGPSDVEAPAGDDGSQGNAYELVEGTGDYRFWLRGRAHPVILSRDDVRSIVAQYVHDGGGATQSEIARQFGLTRRVLNGVLKALRVNKSDPPFTSEDLAERSDDDLLDEWLATKAAKLERKAHRAIWRSVERDAMRWREWERSTLQYIAQAVTDATLAPIEPTPPPEEGRRCALLLTPTDLHIGKLAWSGFAPGEYSRDECRRRLWSAVAQVIDLAPGSPEVIYLTIGGDLFHADGTTGTTTRGTPQDLDGTPEQMITEGIALMFALVRSLAEVAPVRLVLHGGNHDSALSLALYAALLQAFEGCDRVEAAGDPDHPWGPYQVVRYGDSLIGYTHGDHLHRVADLAPLMAQRWPALWGATRWRYWITGHRHHMRIEDARGVEVHSLPSLSGADRWHARNYPTGGRPALVGHVLDPVRGMVATVRGVIDDR